MLLLSRASLIQNQIAGIAGSFSDLPCSSFACLSAASIDTGNLISSHRNSRCRHRCSSPHSFAQYFALVTNCDCSCSIQTHAESVPRPFISINSASTTYFPFQLILPWQTSADVCNTNDASVGHRAGAATTRYIIYLERQLIGAINSKTGKHRSAETRGSEQMVRPCLRMSAGVKI